MTVGRGFLVVLLLGCSASAFADSHNDVLLAWQMETVEPGQGQGIVGDDSGAPGFGSGMGPGQRGGADIGIGSVRPGDRGPLFGDETRRPTVFGEGREPFYRPGPGRNCSGVGPGRVCF